MAASNLPRTVLPRLICLASVILAACGAILDSAAPDFDSPDVVLFHQDYTPPAPPPPPPHPPALTCLHLGGVGSLDTTCEIVSDLYLSDDVYVEGRGNFVISRNVTVNCASFAGCELSINITGNFSLGENSSIICGSFQLIADSSSLGNGSTVNTTGLGGTPPPQTSGTPQGIGGGGGGHGGRGAACLTDKTKLPEDVWGGDAYSWASLKKPWNYGSRGGTTSREVDYGGGGGGRVMFIILRLLELNGSILADGGDGGVRGGGGSGGSIYIKAQKMSGTGRISACGGSGFAGGGGGRVSVVVFSWHHEPAVDIYGGSSRSCPENSGAAGTFYDSVPRSLTISNNHKSTYTDTLLMDFPQPSLTNVYICDQAKAAIPLLWSHVMIQGQIKLSSGELTFGLAHYTMSEFELFAEELLMSDSVLRVFGALRMSVKMFLMWNSKMIINGGRDETVGTSLLGASNLLVLRESSLIHSNASLGVQGQGSLNLSGPGDCIEAQHLVLSLFASIKIGHGSVLRGPFRNTTEDDVMPELHCDSKSCPVELLHPPEDCNVNASLAFTLQICRVEDILVQGLVEGSVVLFHRARTVTVQPSGIISTSGMGCKGGVGQGKLLGNGLGSGGGHGGQGGMGCYNDSCIEGGVSYGDADLPCELGSGSGNDSLAMSTAGGGILVMGSLEYPLQNLYVEGSIRADGENSKRSIRKKDSLIDVPHIGPGGGSGGTILLFLHTLSLGGSAILSGAGGNGSMDGGGGGGGGRIHFHWSDIATGDVYWPTAFVNGSILVGGGFGGSQSLMGEDGTVSGKACPKGLYGIFCEECPDGTYKNVTGSDRSLCSSCPSHELPGRAVYIHVRGGVTEAPCPYKCISGRYHLPHCYTSLEEMVYTFGGPWVFSLLFVGVLILLAMVLSVARVKFIGEDEVSGPGPSQHGSSLTDHSFPFLESLNEVLETNRAEESQSHMHRLFFMGSNTFSAPWHLPHSPPRQVKEIVYEGAYNTFVDEINVIAAYQWWEGSVHIILCCLAYPLAWSWKQWRRRVKLQRIREFVRSEYDHACLRSCRSRALYEGLKIAATPDLMVAYLDFFLGGDEKRGDLPPCLRGRFPLTLVFGGDGSYMAPFSLHNDNIITNLMSQAVPPTTWYRFVAGLNARLRLVHKGCLKRKFRPIIEWLETCANTKLQNYGVRVDLAMFQVRVNGYCQYGLVIYSAEEADHVSFGYPNEACQNEQHSSAGSIFSLKEEIDSNQSQTSSEYNSRQKIYQGILDTNSLKMLKEKRHISILITFLLHNSRPINHQDLVGLAISTLLLGDFSLVLLTLLHLYSLSLADVFLVLTILPLGILIPFPAGINALFSHGPRRSAALARLYALWNISSLINTVVAFICGYVHYSKDSSSRLPNFQPLNMDGNEWWIFPSALLLCKCIQSKLINWHVANLEIQDRSMYSKDFTLFWRS